MGDLYESMGVHDGEAEGRDFRPRALLSARLETLKVVRVRHDRLMPPSEDDPPRSPLMFDDVRVDAMRDLELARQLRAAIKPTWRDAVRRQWEARAAALETRARVELELRSPEHADQARALLADEATEWHPRDRWALEAVAAECEGRAVAPAPGLVAHEGDDHA